MGRGRATRKRIIQLYSGHKKIIWITIAAGLILWFWFSLPQPLFTDPTCTILEDSQGRLLSARIAEDGQWRFPGKTDVPEKFERAILQFEDKYFYKHPGVNPFSILRALKENMEAGEIISGGSTLTMQLIRLSRKGKPRTVYQKLVEMILAVRAEIRYSKKDILALYAAHAPFGGNVVGLDAAAWRYYNRSPEHLSWAETAALAVLPNAPSLIFPGKNKAAFKAKRDALLKELQQEGIIDQTTYELAIDEPLPGKPKRLPQLTPHLVNHALEKGHKGERLKTSINRRLQKRVENITERHHQRLKYNQIHNAAVLVLDTETGQAKAYVGNTRDPKNRHQNRVNVVTAPRSSGSILKPILYAARLDDGTMLPNTLVADVPTQINGYSPKNFDEQYDGAVSASTALYRSLNIPAVRMLQDYGLEKFYQELKKLDFTTLNHSANHYGLSLILGGCEVTLWDITGVYASMARSLDHFTQLNSRYDPEDYHPPGFTSDYQKGKESKAKRESSLFSAASIWFTFDALTKLHRPRQERGWKIMGSSRKIAWKTGTSFGFRDGWAIGVTPQYTVGVWVGNADGEGRPGLTGLNAAAPLLFDVFKELPVRGWFDPPYDEMIKTEVCKKSGHLASRHCPESDSVFIPETGLRTRACPYHQTVHLNSEGTFRVTSECSEVYEMQHKSWFVLPPVMEWYYKRNHPGYKELPPMALGCTSVEHSMEMIHPKPGAEIFIPVGLDGSKGKTVFRAAHRNDEATIYWHLNKRYIGKTTHQHQISLQPEPGEHILNLVDKQGNTLSVNFEIVE